MLISATTPLLLLSLSSAFRPCLVISRHRGHPLLASDLLYNPSEDELYNIFWSQISDLGKADIRADDGESHLPERKVGIANRRFVESHVRLYPGIPLELIHNKRLVFANFVQGNPTSGSIKVRTAAGVLMDVSVSQIISSWDTVADESPPVSEEDWAAVAMEALDVLRDLSPRKADLREFHSMLLTLRSASLPVDSIDLGVYIFQERRFKAWLNPYDSAESAGVYALSSAQRYAAALLLFHDDFHFKRRPSSLLREEELQDRIEESEVDLDSFMDGGDDDDVEDSSLFLIEGGYKALDEGVVLFKEGDAFLAYYQEKTRLNSSAPLAPSPSPFRAGCVSRQLRALEVSLRAHQPSADLI